MTKHTPQLIYADTMKSQQYPATRVVMMPHDTNGMGNIFGGVILSHIDLAGAVEARRFFNNRFATVCMKEVVFRKLVLIGDVLVCWARLEATGTTSVTVHINVEAERDGQTIPVTEATVIYVSVNDNVQPVPLSPFQPNPRQRQRKLLPPFSQTRYSHPPAQSTTDKSWSQP